MHLSFKNSYIVYTITVCLSAYHDWLAHMHVNMAFPGVFATYAWIQFHDGSFEDSMLISSDYKFSVCDMHLPWHILKQDVVDKLILLCVACFHYVQINFWYYFLYVCMMSWKQPLNSEPWRSKIPFIGLRINYKKAQIGHRLADNKSHNHGDHAAVITGFSTVYIDRYI